MATQSQHRSKAKSKAKSSNSETSSKANTQKGTDILAAIKSQHKILKESIKVLKSEKSEDVEKKDHLTKFIPILKMHSEAEEQTIYALMSERAEEDDEEQTVIEAKVEHKIAKTLIEELEKLDYKNQWSVEIAAKAKVLAEVVEHHAMEEEDEFFEAVRENLERAERLEVGEQFLQKFNEGSLSDIANSSSMTPAKGKDKKKSAVAPPMH